MRERGIHPPISRWEAYKDLGRSVKEHPIPLYIAGLTTTAPELPVVMKTVFFALCLSAMRRNFNRYIDNH